MNFTEKDANNWKRSGRNSKPYSVSQRNQSHSYGNQSIHRQPGGNYGQSHSFSQPQSRVSSARIDGAHSSGPWLSGSSSGFSADESQGKTFRVDTKQYERTSLMATWNVEKKIGHYSLDDNYAVKWDSSGVKYFAPEKCSQSLNLFGGFSEEGYDKEQLKRDQYNASYSISQLIDWMKRNKDKLTDKPNFVIKHDFLKKIIMSTCEHRRSWEMEAVIHDGVIYISKLRADEAVDMGSNPVFDRRRKEASYGGLMFEKVTTRRNDTVASCDKFYSVLSGMLAQASQSQWHSNAPSGSLRFLFSAEIDAIVGNDAQACETIQNYVEIKTTVLPRAKPGTRRKFGFLKLLDWWNHCYLAGIPRIFIGIRNPGGALEETILSSACAIPGIEAIQRSQQPCMDFFFAFFTWVKEVVEKEGTVYEFSFYPQNSFIIKCREIRQPDHPFLLLFKENTLIFF